MAPIPITLVGDNLDQRHKYLNSLVNKSFENGEDFELIKVLPEKSLIDRLYKINLAVKLRNVDYIIQNLQDDDMLFVSKALKATWLLEKQHENLINPDYLEDNLYPKMITTAVNKMQHWIHLNLKDEKRCKTFYDYYLEKNFDLALKFFAKCSKEDIEHEFNKVMHNITPHYLKVLSEKTSKVVKIFFDSISSDHQIKRQYLDNAKAYFDTTRHLLKTDGEMVLDVAEKYFDKDMDSHRYSKEQTKIIMKYHKDRFWNKPELYTAWLLNIEAIADSLQGEEVKMLVQKLARASYLSYWFTYQNIEPLIKRLKPDERPAFKNKIFVDKDFGDVIEDWPYDTPTIPTNSIEYVTIFDDNQPDPSEYRSLLKRAKVPKRLIMKKRGLKNECCEIYCEEKRDKRLLDKLFDEFRFMSFGKTLYELRKRLSAESSPQNRQFIILVLISKTGGRPDDVAALLELLTQHVNETVNFRAAIIRSLVKRAQVWRLPEVTWDQLLKFSQGLGLDGKEPEAECFEGLHAVIIRSLLLTGDCETNVKNTYVFKHFSTFDDYALDTVEKAKIAVALPKMLHKLVYEIELFDKLGSRTPAYCIEKLVDTLKTYKISIETYPGLIDTIEKFAVDEMSSLDYILLDLYRSKIARKQLFRHMFPLVRTDESHLNALRHDTSVLYPKNFAEMYGIYIISVTRFFRKLSLYFSEENGLARNFLHELKAKEHDKVIGKPIALLLNDQLVPYLDELDASDNIKSKLLASVVRSNAHFARPALDLGSYGWQKIGAKYLEGRFLNCRSVDIDNCIENLLKWKRTARIALVLAKRTSYQTEVFVKLASMRPTIAIKTGLTLIKSQGETTDIKIWETIEPIVREFDVKNDNKVHIVKKLEAVDEIPLILRPEYGIQIYNLFLKNSFYQAMPTLCHIELLLPDVNEQFIENIVKQFLENDFLAEKLIQDRKQILCTGMFIRFLTKHVLLSKTEEEQKSKIDVYLKQFLAVLDEIRKDADKEDLLKKYFSEMCLTLKYSKVFLSTQYVSPLPIIETIIAWMRERFTVVIHFTTFAKLHLLMLFYKAIQQALDLVPDVFSDNNRRNTEGIDIFGNIFGKYIASEVANLQIEYFDSIPELYCKSLVAFLETYSCYNIILSDLLTSITKGIFGEHTVPAYRLGINLINEKHYDLREEQCEELVKFVHKIDFAESQWLNTLLEV